MREVSMMRERERFLDRDPSTSRMERDPRGLEPPVVLGGRDRERERDRDRYGGREDYGRKRYHEDDAYDDPRAKRRY